jgi:hypothetical protein
MQSYAPSLYIYTYYHVLVTRHEVLVDYWIY